MEELQTSFNDELLLLALPAFAGRVAEWFRRENKRGDRQVEEEEEVEVEELQTSLSTTSTPSART